MICAKNRLIVFFLLLTWNSCNLGETDDEGPSEITTEIEGTYEFKYPSKQVEVLNIKNDLTFSQAFYTNEKDYLNKNALYENSGTWTFSGKEIKFDHWLAFCKDRDPDSILAQPYHGTMLNVYWYAPINKHEGWFNFFYENGYVFKKVKTDSSTAYVKWYRMDCQKIDMNYVDGAAKRPQDTLQEQFHKHLQEQTAFNIKETLQKDTTVVTFDFGDYYSMNFIGNAKVENDTLFLSFWYAKDTMQIVRIWADFRISFHLSNKKKHWKAIKTRFGKPL